MSNKTNSTLSMDRECLAALEMYTKAVVAVAEKAKDTVSKLADTYFRNKDNVSGKDVGELLDSIGRVEELIQKVGEDFYTVQTAVSLASTKFGNASAQGVKSMEEARTQLQTIVAQVKSVK